MASPHERAWAEGHKAGKHSNCMVAAIAQPATAAIFGLCPLGFLRRPIDQFACSLTCEY